MKIGIVSLGCAKNQVDSEEILGLFKENEAEIVSNPQDAEIIIVNTCGFIESAKRESIDTILEMATYNKILVVTGCLVERYKEELIKELPEVDLFIAIRDYPHFSELINEVYRSHQFHGVMDPMKRVLSTPKYTAYLKISEGCNNRCTYCAIPLIRGGFHSKPHDELIDEARVLSKKGIKELVVISQDTTRYGSDTNKDGDIVSLLKDLLKFKNFEYIRLLYLYPDEISDELIDLIAQEPRLTSYFDIPMQHASDHILKDMHRRGDKKYLKELVEKIRIKVPKAIVRTTLIVGFPGETEEDFNELLEFVEEIKFDHLGAFTYSPEDGTPSCEYPNQVPEKVKKARLSKLMKIQKKISKEKNLSHIGEIQDGLITGFNEEKNLYTFRSYYNAPDDVDGDIFVQSDIPLDLGQKVQVKIVRANTYDLYGVIR